MFYDVFKKDNVVKFLNDISNGEIYKEKDIPTSINNEKIDKSYYSILMGLDAIIKYIIIIDDMFWFDEYLKEVQLLLRKVSKHNDIKIGINKLLINYSKQRLRLKDINSKENKEEIIKYIYRKYIVEGYFFHSFPSVFIDIVKNEGLLSSNYNYEIDSLKEISLVFEKYKTYNVFSKELENKNNISITDSPFMACFYAYNSPCFLKELALGLTDKNNKCIRNSFFMKNYKLSRKNLVHFIKKVDMFNNDSNKVIEIFDREWDIFNVGESFPVIGMIKRSIFNEKFLNDINVLINEGINKNLVDAVTKILNANYNQKNTDNDISALNIIIIYLPTIKELGYEINDNDTKQKMDLNKEKKSIDEYGNSSIIALVGLILITIGLLISIIMLGR